MKWPFKKSLAAIKVDIHSHLIPGIDDGSSSEEKSLEMIRLMQAEGFEKIITTPHIHPKYPNSEQQILAGLTKLQDAVKRENITIDLEAAAEYYVDEKFMERVEKKESLLSFGDRYILVECSFNVKPFFFESVIYKLKENGYRPVLAHPERYKFLEGNIGWLNQLKTTGVLFQVTLGSIGGYYGSMPKKIGIELIKNEMVDFLASDLHRSLQFDFLKKGLRSKEVQQLLKKGRVVNSELI